MLQFYTCPTCGNIVEMIEDSGIIPYCCGNEMEELIPGTTDGAKEKHIPVCVDSPKLPADLDAKLCTHLITIKVGEAPHPMTPAHSIEWITVCTNQGIYRKNLDVTKPAEAEFCLKKDEKIEAVYAYCNLHGLWVHCINQIC